MRFPVLLPLLVFRKTSMCLVAMIIKPVPVGTFDTMLALEPKFGVWLPSICLWKTRACWPSLTGRSGMLNARMPPVASARVVINISILRVLDLDAGHVLHHAVPAHDDLP